ncbi:MAG: RsiV family protein [Cyclobacteriaceae bacterium]|nr:RsiV family protein [Cyclobacteriaceae bacterium]
MILSLIRYGSKPELEQAFRADRGLDESQSLTEMGYFIEENGFTLTNNMGLTESELLVQFNPYEIAPYSLGPTTITLNRQELGDILKLR